MRSTLAHASIYLLVLLLAVTFPIGAGDAEHGGALLHPTFGHVHLAGGEHTLSNSMGRAARQQSTANVALGPAIANGAGAASEMPTTGLTPAVPRSGVWLPMGTAARLSSVERPVPPSLFEAPPDPPPTSRTWS